LRLEYNPPSRAPDDGLAAGFEAGGRRRNVLSRRAIPWLREVFVFREQGMNPIIGTIALVVFYVVVCVAFVRITQSGFSEMEPRAMAP
jgi:hypothetical protein